MAARIVHWIKGHRELTVFILVGAFLGINTGLYEPTFNNYLNDTFRVSAVVRGGLEFPRELPGMLVALVSGLLFFLPDTRMGSFSLGLTALGLIGLAYFSPAFGFMAFWMVVNSLGTHLYMPLSTSIGVTLSEQGAVGRRLGQLQGISTAAMVLGSMVVWAGFSYFHLSYRAVFTIAAVCAAVAAVLLLKIPPRPRRSAKVRFVFKRRYSLFYLLNVLFGARKQVFLTFGPWVLIKIFHQTPAAFAALSMTGSIAGIVFKPMLGRAVDRFGERFIITLESLLLVLVCLGYGFSEGLLAGNAALYLVFACYIMDQLLYAVNMARATYLHKIVDVPDDLTPTLSMGISLDHVVSMLIPIAGGVIWSLFGYQYVFLGAALIALFNLVAARWIGREGFRRAGGAISSETAV